MMRSCIAVCYAAVVLSLLIMLGGCAGQGAPESAGTQSTAYAEELAALNSLTAPEGVSAALWGELTAELARVLEERTASAPPAGAASATILGYDEASAALSWGYYSSGDYDQNGEVGISDLTPLGIHFGKTAGEGEGGSFDVDSIEAVVDGNGDGEINIADITPIGVNFGVVMEGYRVYMSESVASYPPEPDAPNGLGTTWIDSVSFASADGGAGAGRKRFSVQVVPTLSAQHFWVRPYEGSADGAASNYVVVKLPPKTAPQAKLSTSGVPATPAQITWDASQSSDADGQIVRYEWDFDDDGEYEYDGGDIPTADFYYYEEGNYGAAVRVTDDDGLSDTASWAVIITTAATWHVERVDGANSPYTHILNLAGRPAIFYFPRYEEPGNPSQHIIRAEDEFGSSWEDPLPISAPLRENGFVLVEGHPATTALWFDVPTQMNSLRFWRASDDGGTAWPSPVVLLETAFSNDAFTLLIYDGKPAVLYDFPLRYMLAKDATGSAWNEPVETPKSRGALSVIDGRFAMAYDGVGLTFTRAVNYDATEWTDAVEIDQPAVSENIKLIEAGGVPGIAYYDDTLQVMKYVPAVDAAGSAWREPVIIVNGRYTRYTLEIVDGRPVIVYYDYSGKTVHFVSSNNAQGSSWGRPALVATEVELPFIGQSPSVTDLNGRPAICFLEKDKVDPNLFQDRQLTYASMY